MSRLPAYLRQSIVLVLVLLVCCVCFGGGGRAASVAIYPSHAIVTDVSWPNCRAAPPADNTWGIVGITGGRVFEPNTCVKQETLWFKNYSVYVNTAYPGDTRGMAYATSPLQCGANDIECLAYNFGYNAGDYAVKLAASQNIHASMWWLDVETENSWSTDTLANRMSLQGMADAIHHETLVSQIGYYSYPGQWDLITGGWRNGMPAWTATGSAARAGAIDFCKGHIFTGSVNMLSQYTPKLDASYVCD